MLMGATGNHPSHYAQPDSPPMWRDVVLPSGAKHTSAYDGSPPVRSGIIAASSARQKHRTTPAAATANIIGTAAAPRPCTAAGASPVTRIVPASPITKAPHQLVPFCRPTVVVVSATVPPLLLAELPAPQGASTGGGYPWVGLPSTTTLTRRSGSDARRGQEPLEQQAGDLVDGLDVAQDVVEEPGRRSRPQRPFEVRHGLGRPDPLFGHGGGDLGVELHADRVAPPEGLTRV